MEKKKFQYTIISQFTGSLEETSGLNSKIVRLKAKIVNYTCTISSWGQTDEFLEPIKLLEMQLYVHTRLPLLAIRLENVPCISMQ